jgi:hypothetical protein
VKPIPDKEHFQQLNMKSSLYRLIPILLINGSILLTGCGGGGGGSGSGSGAANPAAAPQSLTGKSLRLAVDGGTERRLEFAGSGSNYAEIDPSTGGTSRTGNYVYSASGSNGNLTLMDSANADVTTLSLSFDSSEGGAFGSTTSNGVTSAGRFALVAGNFPESQPPGENNGENPGGGGDPGGDPGNGNTGPTTPVGDSLDGRIMTLTRSTGQTHTYTFRGSQFVDSDPPEEGSGTFSFNRSGSSASLTLNYTASNAPVNLAGDQHQIQMTFNEEFRGTYTSTYTTREGAVLPQDGTFRFVQ